MRKDTKEVETINSIERALDVIILLYREECELGILEISRMLGVYQSTIYRTIATLEKKGFVYQNHETSKYGLGLKLYSIGMVAGHSFSWLTMAEPFIHELGKEFGETVNLSIMDESEKEELRCILVRQATVKHRVLGSSQMIGDSTECYTSAVGKVLLAFAEENVDSRIRKAKFVRSTEHTITDPEELINHLKIIKERGYGLDEEEQEEGLFCIACPVLKSDDVAMAAISISGPKGRMEAIGVEKIVTHLKKVCGEISKLVR